MNVVECDSCGTDCTSYSYFHKKTQQDFCPDCYDSECGGTGGEHQINGEKATAVSKSNGNGNGNGNGKATKKAKKTKSVPISIPVPSELPVADVQLSIEYEYKKEVVKIENDVDAVDDVKTGSRSSKRGATKRNYSEVDID
jgi:hypothetical protein